MLKDLSLHRYSSCLVIVPVPCCHSTVLCCTQACLRTFPLSVPRLSASKSITTKRTKIKRKQKYYHDGHALAKPLRDLPLGNVVRIRLPGQSTWSTGVCTKKLPYRSYHVFADGTTYRRNRHDLLVIPADQPESPIVEVSPKPCNMTAEPDAPAQMPQSSKVVVPTSTPSTSSCGPTRRSQRSVRKPAWHADYQTK